MTEPDSDPALTLAEPAQPAEPAEPDAPLPASAPNAGEAWLGLPSVRHRLERLMPRPVAAAVELLLICALALGLAEGVQAAVVKPFKIPSASMEPTLAIGQRILVNRLVYRLHAPHRGDIIVFHPPTSLQCAVPTAVTEPCPQGNGKEATTYFVKRVVALPGERLSILDGHPVINGHEISNEPYIAPCGDAQGCNLSTSIVIPRGDVFVMGDNRGNSDDSRFWGPVPDSWIIGQAFFTYWPLNRLGTP